MESAARKQINKATAHCYWVTAGAPHVWVQAKNNELHILLMATVHTTSGSNLSRFKHNSKPQVKQQHQMTMLHRNEHLAA